MMDRTSSPTPLSYPYLEPAVRDLSVGDRISLSGRLFTGRDRLHKHLAEGGSCPVPLRDGGLFHCGPVVIPRPGGGWDMRAAGPTTSMREEPYMATIVERYGLRVIIGKGGMGSRTQEACRRGGCVYLQAVGGAAAAIATRIRAVLGVWFLEEFGPTEALWELEVRALELIVGIDARGTSLYEQVERTSRQALEQVLAAPCREPTCRNYGCAPSRF